MILDAIAMGERKGDIHFLFGVIDSQHHFFSQTESK